MENISYFTIALLYLTFELNFVSLSDISLLNHQSKTNEEGNKLIKNVDKFTRKPKFLPFSPSNILISNYKNLAFNTQEDTSKFPYPSDDLRGRIFNIFKLRGDKRRNSDPLEKFKAEMSANFHRSAEALENIAMSFERMSTTWKFEFSESILMMLISALENIAESMALNE
ncbi:UNVERIFIED_CONTAM: hypothetical protein RMT77_006430 [Armadillidium vulgare]